MLSLWVVNAMLAVQAAATLTPDTSSTSNCTESPQDDTISFFSHAPLTFSFDVPSALLCATKCADVSPCRAWLYSSSGQECQLYRQQPLFQAHNPLFVSGICGRSSVLPSAIPFPSISTPAASSHSLIHHHQPTASAPVRRDWATRQRHHHGHSHGHRHHV